MEEWRPVVGYEGLYEVSDLGRVRSLDRVTSHGHRRKGSFKARKRHHSGYMIVQLWSKGVSSNPRVHRLVLEAFVGPAPAGRGLGLHGNGNPGDNTLPNLRWGNGSENEQDKKKHGRNWKSNREECPWGHPYSHENTYITPGTGHRRCKECARQQKRGTHPLRVSEKANMTKSREKDI